MLSPRHAARLNRQLAICIMFLAVPSKYQVILLITIGTGILCWPAFFNGMPLLFEDSMAYIGDGSHVARALFLRETWYYYGHRSFIYGLGILPFHLRANLWPVVVLQGLLTGYVLWLVVRSFHFRLPFVSWSAIIIVLSTSTGLAWFVSYIMPDILGPLLYLIIYLIVFRWNSLGGTERTIVFIIGAWCAASHSTHLSDRHGSLCGRSRCHGLETSPLDPRCKGGGLGNCRASDCCGRKYSSTRVVIW
jgi:hypothetical protein